MTTNMITKRFVFLALLAFIIFGSPVSFAAHYCPVPGSPGVTERGNHYGDEKYTTIPKGAKVGEPVPCTFIGKIAKDLGYDISDVFGWAIGLGSIVALGVITYGGTLYASSGLLFGSRASEEQVHKGKAWVIAGLQGLAVLIGAYLIINTINPNILLF